MLTRLGVPATALFFPGGATGAECDAWARAQGIACQTFPVPVATRVGLVVRAPDRPETTFFSPDIPLDAAAVRACADHLARCPAGDVLAICGSVPGWASAACDTLRAAVDRWLERGPVVVDTYGPPLAWLIERPVAWVKINRTEFDALFGRRNVINPWSIVCVRLSDGGPRVLGSSRTGRSCCGSCSGTRLRRASRHHRCPRFLPLDPATSSCVSDLLGFPPSTAPVRRPAARTTLRRRQCRAWHRGRLPAGGPARSWVAACSLD